MTRTDPEIGIEKLCKLCGEWWPLDDEFYYPSNQAYCKACWIERNRQRSRGLTFSRAKAVRA